MAYPSISTASIASSRSNGLSASTITAYSSANSLVLLASMAAAWGPCWPSRHQALQSATLELVRTTVDIDPDIIQVVRTLARDRKQTMGRTLSDLARLGLYGSQVTRAEYPANYQIRKERHPAC